MKNIVTSLKLVTIYKNVLKDEVIFAFVDFLSYLNISDDFDIILKSYSDFLSQDTESSSAKQKLPS